MSKSKDSKSETIHPLLMDPVLQILFNLLNVHDVKNCRLVTPQWSTKGFHALKGKTVIKIYTKSKLKKFFTPSVELGGVSASQIFVGFSFEIQEGWEEVNQISEYVKTHGAQYLVVNYALDTSLRSYEGFQNLLSNHHNKLTKLSVTVRKLVADTTYDTFLDGTMQTFSVPESLKQLKYPLLKSLTVIHAKDDGVEQDAYQEMSHLWIQVIRKSANLKHFCVHLAYLEDTTFWSELTNGSGLRTFETLESLSIPLITSEVSQIISRQSRLNLKKLEIMFVPDGVDSILQRVAHSLETLKFITPNESALSPVNFPVMSKLKTLSSGNSQLSFPSITLRQLPVLEEVHVTYWDWVWTFEELPDGHYYWRTDEPHPKVTTLVIRFPPLKDVTGNYLVMENYVDFCGRIAEKFPSLRTIKLKNVYYNSSTIELPGSSKLMDIVRGIGEGLKEIVVLDYCTESETNYLDLMSPVKDVEILDLNPTEWLKVWNGEPNDVMDYTVWNVPPLPDLRVAKLIWIANFELYAFVERAPRLIHLEVIGGRCLDRFDRYKMRKLMPGLKFIQHSCSCALEDSWYVSDTTDDNVFGRLFCEEIGAVTANQFQKEEV